MSITDKTTTNGTRHPTTSSMVTNGSLRTENLPPHVNGRAGHRTTRSQEEEQRRRNGAKARANDNVLDIFADPVEPTKPHERRPRRNSESSVAERNGKVLDPEEERRRRERRHRDREIRHRERDSKGRPIPSAGPRGKKPSHRLDVIDKLDVTSIYGTGRELH